MKDIIFGQRYCVEGNYGSLDNLIVIGKNNDYFFVLKEGTLFQTEGHLITKEFSENSLIDPKYIGQFYWTILERDIRLKKRRLIRLKKRRLSTFCPICNPDGG